MQKKIPLIYLTRAACIAAIYFILTVLLEPLSYGPIQLRFSEALTLLPIIFPEAIAGLTIGCALANIFSWFGIVDIVLGSLTTLIAAILTYMLRRKPLLAALPPILLNAAIVPIVIILSGDTTAYYLLAGSILISQAIIIYALGLPLTQTLKRTLFLNKKTYENDKKDSDFEKFDDKSN